MNRFSYLTFDCYGTLIDWRTGIEDALTKALGALPRRGGELAALYASAEKQQENSYKKYRDVLSDTAAVLAHRLGKAMGEKKALEFAASVPEWPAFPDSASSLHRLGEMGFRRFILSNVDTDLLQETISRNGFEVDGFVTAEEVRSYKPAHVHWKEFMHRTGARKGEILHIAQSVYHDIIPAQELGISSAWVNRYGEPFPRGVDPEYVVDGVNSLVDLLS